MHILVTGASRGIGYELVKRFTLNDNNKVIAISRNEEQLNRLHDECLERIPTALVKVLPCDLDNDSDLKVLENFVKDKLGYLDLLINNAGYLFNHPFKNFPEEEMRRIFNVNVFAVAKLTRLLLPLLEKSKKPHVVNISSMGGFQGSSKFPGLSMYSASKGALSVLTECMAVELQEKNISVNCLALGAVQTEMLQEAFPGYKPPMTAAQMAKFIEEFATTGHHYFNGKILPVNLSNP